MEEGVYGERELLLQEEEERVIDSGGWTQVASRFFKPIPATYKKLAPGCYEITRDNQDGQPVFIKKMIVMDDLMSFKNDVAARVLNEINTFWGKGDKFKEFNFLHKRGYLFYGPQGVGKSSLSAMISDGIIKRGGIVFICNKPEFFIKGLKAFRQLEPLRPIVCIFEDIDAIINKYGDSELLELLDGSSQISKVVNIASTNFPELLNKRIIGRPRRFDRVYKIEAPSVAVRRAYFKKKLPKGEDVEKWVGATEDLSFASLAEVVISVCCLGNGFEETIEKLKKLERGNPSSDESADKPGFLSKGAPPGGRRFNSLSKRRA